jgi:CBS domain-containing protein
VTSDELTVAEVMHPGVLVCGPESPLRYAAGVMATHGVHAVVVLGDDEEGGLWGVVSDVDLVAAIARRELDLHTAGGMARTPLVTVSREQSLAQAAELMSAHGVTHLIVVGSRHRPIGILSTLDIARAAAAGVVVERRTGASRIGPRGGRVQ